MRVREVTYDNGFTEVFYEDMSPAEEARWFANKVDVKAFPSRNQPAALGHQTPSSLVQEQLQQPPEEPRHL